jgi:glutamate dehydrogenase
MITADPQRRASRIEEILDVLRRDADPKHRELLLSFSRLVVAETPDRVLFGRSAEVMASRAADQFRFFAREIPPAFQLYRGLPGVHVEVRDSEEPREHPPPGRRQLRRRMSVVQTHTLDAPFIFESLKNYFRKSGLRVFSAIHPILSVRRQWERVIDVEGPGGEGTQELLCDFRIEQLESRESRRHVEHEVFCVLKSLFTAVEDFQEMMDLVAELARRIRPRRQAEIGPPRDFLEWLRAGNYIFMGVARYRFEADGRPHRIEDADLGVFKDPDLVPVVFPGLLEEVEAHLHPAAEDERVVDIDYCNNASAIYHLEPIDDIVIREWDASGAPVQATLLLGRFSKGAFTQKAGDIPLIREKRAWLEAHSGAAPKSYIQREIRAVLNRFPTRELFYATPPELKQLIDRIVHMSGDEELAVSVRRGAGYVALHVAFSRQRYSYQAEEALRSELSDAFGPISFLRAEDLGAYMLLLFYFDAARLEHEVDEAGARRVVEPLLQTWEDRTAAALEDAYGEREGRRLFRRFVTLDTRSGLYRESTPPEEVPADVRVFETIEGRLELGVVPRSPEAVLLKVFSPHSLVLTDALRVLTNLGLQVTEDLRMPVTLPEGRKCVLYRFEIQAPPDRIARLNAEPELFVEALRALDEQRASDGSLNAFVLIAGLSWREIEALRTLRNHLLQIRPFFGPETVNGVLLRNTRAAVALFRSFSARFDPERDEGRDAEMRAATAEFEAALEEVTNLLDDEVLRAFHNLIDAAVRTNFYQRPERPVISIKVDSRRVEAMPSPRPMYEIYVHSPVLEGVHLRGGKVARGGLRWSDRLDDFRTEILGLMKTQMLKNSIIIPVGSKGGFVLKGELPPRPALDAYVADRYREFISGLLDVTDNRSGGTVLHPPEVVRHDDDDPYLVVAADKGTAHLSDVANRVSNQYGLWLGDAFASGGSAGYDHKKVGITARGAWECIWHHFRNLGRDIWREPFTIVGIGDMAGDVFGNGLLRSRTTRLVAAFNHLHVFLDPDPDPEASFQERERLFRLPRSTWKDYDPRWISPGGGVFERSAKSIPLSPEVRRLLGSEATSASGEEVVRRILTAPVDLLYSGGIGTYVKASGESHAEVGDRMNDRVRVDARDVRARVVGEGGNLGFTQKARLEYAAGGGLVNTDAIDNSGGVDISDHEVNIKILLEPLVARGAIANRAERNRILLEMTEEVAELVLADNRAQARALTLDALRSAERYEDFVGWIDEMEGAGILNRADDSIPTRDELLGSPARQRGIPRPLLALLLGHAKIWAFERALESELPDGELRAPLLRSYFPGGVRERWESELESHPLSREIVATQAVNLVVNQAGVTYLQRAMRASARVAGDVLVAYLAVDRASRAPELRREILAAGLPAAEEHGLLLAIEERLEPLALRRLAGAAEQGQAELEAIRAQLERPV